MPHIQELGNIIEFFPSYNCSIWLRNAKIKCKNLAEAIFIEKSNTWKIIHVFVHNEVIFNNNR